MRTYTHSLGSGNEATSWTTVATGEEIADRWRTTAATKGARSVDGEQSGGTKRRTTAHQTAIARRCSVAQSRVLIQLLFPSSTARRTKQWLTIKKNDDKQKEQRTTVETLLHILLRSRELVTQCGENQQTKRTWCVHLERYLLVNVSIFVQSILFIETWSSKFVFVRKYVSDICAASVLVGHAVVGLRHSRHLHRAVRCVTT
jgi:hypothetical protein